MSLPSPYDKDHFDDPQLVYMNTLIFRACDSLAKLHECGKRMTREKNLSERDKEELRDVYKEQMEALRG